MAAEARYPAHGMRKWRGPGFLEKVVQLQLALPPPHRDHIRRLLRGDAPDRAFRAMAFADRPSEPALPFRWTSLLVSFLESMRLSTAVCSRGGARGGVLIGALSCSSYSHSGTEGGAVLALLVGVPLLVLAAARRDAGLARAGGT